MYSRAKFNLILLMLFLCSPFYNTLLSQPNEACDWVGPDKVICELNGSVQIGNDFSAGDELGCLQTTYCFNWTPTEGLDNPLSLTPTASPELTETYTLFITDESGDFIAEDQVTVTVDNISNAELYSEYESVCPGSSSDLIVVGIAPDHHTYQWSTGEDMPGITVTSPGTYQVTVSSQNGCVEILTKELSADDLSVIINASSSNLCGGNLLVLRP